MQNETQFQISEAFVVAGVRETRETVTEFRQLRCPDAALMTRSVIVEAEAYRISLAALECGYLVSATRSGASFAFLRGCALRLGDTNRLHQGLGRYSASPLRRAD